MKQKSLTLLAV